MLDVHDIHDRLKDQVEKAKKIALSSPAEGYEMASEIKREAEEYSLISLKGHALYIMALACRTMGQPMEAFEYVNEALGIFEMASDQEMIMNLQSLLGILYFYSGDYKTALHQFYQAQMTAMQIKNYFRLVSILNNIGEVHRKAENYSEALKVYKDGIQIGKEYHVYESMGLLLSNIAEVYTILGEYEDALETFNSARKYIDSTDDSLVKFEWYYRMGKLCMVQGLSRCAQEHIENSERLFKSIENKYYIIDVLLIKYDWLIDHKMSKEAIDVLFEAEAFSKESKSDHQLSLVYEKFYKHYESIGMYKETFEYYKRYQYILKKIEASNLMMKLKMLEYKQNTLEDNRKDKFVIDFFHEEIRLEEQKLGMLIEDLETKEENYVIN